MSVGQAEDGLGGSLSLFQGGDGSACPRDMQRGLRLQTDPAERGRPCRPGGPAAGQEEHPMSLRSRVSPPRLWRALSQLGPRGLPPPDSAAGDLRSPNQGSSWAGPPSLRRKRPLRLAGPERKPSSFVSQLCGLGRPLWEAGVRTVPASIQAGSWEDMFKAPSSAWHLTGMLRDLAVAVLTQEVALGTSFKDPGV